MFGSNSKGLIQIITGPMFSGKTEELIKRVRILEYADVKTLIIKPEIDGRFSKNKIISRSGVEVKTFSIKNANEIYQIWNDSYDAIIIDEAQFFDKTLIPIIEDLAIKGKRIIISGLDTDFNMKPFGIMPYLLAIADDVTKLVAVCLKCKEPASKTYRKSNNKDITQIGDKEIYEARCRLCHSKSYK